MSASLGRASLARIILPAVMLATLEAHAGIVGWFTSEAREWEFIQRSGGIRLGVSLEKEGRRVLPVEYWPEGNSGLAVRKVQLKRRDAQLVIRVFTQLVEKRSATARIHYVDLSGIPPGRYEVYYGTVANNAGYLGPIDIQ